MQKFEALFTLIYDLSFLKMRERRKVARINTQLIDRIT